MTHDNAVYTALAQSTEQSLVADSLIHTMHPRSQAA